MSKKKTTGGDSAGGTKAAKAAAPSKAKSTAVKAKPATKTERAKAGAAANPVQVKDVENPPGVPPAAGLQAPAKGTEQSQDPPATARPMLPFKRPATFNFAGVGRNDICPCGSGKRFKNCHGR